MALPLSSVLKLTGAISEVAGKRESNMLKCLLFDLDNTLYPKSLGIFERVVGRIRNYMEARMGFEKNVALELRQDYIKNHGSTLRGLMIHHQVDPAEYLDFVHDVGVENILRPNPGLVGLLQSVSFEKVIFTSSHRPHALKVLRCLGVDQYFSSIFDIAFTHYIPKPNPEAYGRVLDALGLPGGRCMMIDDQPANLRTAKSLGMRTVLVGQDPDRTDGSVDREISDILELGEALKL